RAPDGGRRARLERAAQTVAVLRGLGYAGAYLGGTHDADQVAWIIRRADELAPRWEDLQAELTYGLDDGFYLYPRTIARRPSGAGLAGGSSLYPRPRGRGPWGAGPAGAAGAPPRAEAPASPLRPAPGQGRLARRLVPPVLDGLGRLFPVTRQSSLRRLLRRLAAWAD